MTSVRFGACVLGSLLSLSVVVVQAATPQASLEQSERAEARIKDGEAAAAAGKWDAAVEQFLSATKLNPNSVVAFYDLGVAQEHLGNSEQAAIAEHQAIRLDPNYVPALVELGCILSNLHETEEALQAERRALELDPGNQTAQTNLKAIIATGHTSQAAPSVAAVMPAPAAGQSHTSAAVQPTSALAAGRQVEGSEDIASPPKSDAEKLRDLIAAGDSAYRAGQSQVAQRSFQQAVLLCPDSSQAHANLGVVLGAQGDIDGQLVQEKLAVQIDSHNALALANLGWAYAKLERWTDALRAYNKALAIKPTLSDAQVGRGLALFNVGSKDAAVKALLEAQANSAAAAGPCIALGSIYLQQGKLEASEKELRQALAIQPENMEATQLLALVLLQSAKPEEAEKLFRKVAQSTGSGAAAYAGLSLALELKGDKDGAEKEARRALDLNPRVRIAQVTLDRLALRKEAGK